MQLLFIHMLKMGIFIKGCIILCLFRYQLFTINTQTFLLYSKMSKECEQNVTPYRYALARFIFVSNLFCFFPITM